MKTCRDCDETKPLDEFYRSSGRVNQWSSYCKPCHKTRNAEARKRHYPNRDREGWNAARMAQYRERYQFFATYKTERGCIDCGFNAHHAALEFDHVRGEKKFNISGGAFQSRSMASLMEEVAKCEIRCSNCHSIVTYERLQER